MRKNHWEEPRLKRRTFLKTIRTNHWEEPRFKRWTSLKTMGQNHCKEPRLRRSNCLNPRGRTTRRSQDTKEEPWYYHKEELLRRIKTRKENFSNGMKRNRWVEPRLPKKKIFLRERVTLIAEMKSSKGLPANLHGHWAFGQDTRRYNACGSRQSPIK